MKPANDSYMAIVNWMDWNNVGILNASHCTTVADLDGTQYGEEAYQLGYHLK